MVRAEVLGGGGGANVMVEADVERAGVMVGDTGGGGRGGEGQR